MRTWLIATAGLTMAAAGATAGVADAQQRVVAHGPAGMRPGATYAPPMRASAPAMQSWQAPRVAPAGQWQRGGQSHMQLGQPPIQPGQPARPPMVWNNGARPPIVHAGQPRWGSKVGGRWWGGANAPGGWSAYRRPYRGYALPSYWVAPRFFVNDWQGYGLSQPGSGYNWVRYYDDAVLVDGRGSVYDTRNGVDWDRYDDGYAQDYRVYADGGYDDRAYDDRGYDDRAYADRGYDDRGRQRRDNGVGGAVVGAAVGGVAGNLIAGRGNRLGGTLIGAGVGAAAGYAIDKAEDRRAPAAPAYRGRDYAVPVAPDRAPPPPPVYADRGYAEPVAPPPPPVGYRQGGPDWRSSDGTTTVTTTNGGGYYRGGYYYPGASTTTVVVQTAPVVTTTTTEIYEDAVTYTRRPAARSKTRRVWRPAPKCACQ